MPRTSSRRCCPQNSRPWRRTYNRSTAAETCSRGNGCTLTIIPAAPAGCPLGGGLILLISNLVLGVDSTTSVIGSPRRTDSTQNRGCFRGVDHTIYAELAPYAGGSGHAPDGIAVPSGASAISHDCRRYAFGHVICADADALQARPPSNGR